MTENKKLDALIIIVLLVAVIILSIITPRGPACMDTGRGDMCTQEDFDNFKKGN